MSDTLTGKHSLHDVARTVLDLCNERVEAYKAHLEELSQLEKGEIKPTFTSQEESKNQRTELDAAGKMKDVKAAKLKSVKKEEMGTSRGALQHEAPHDLAHAVPNAAPNMGLQHEVPQAAAGLQHEVPKAPMAMKNDACAGGMKPKLPRKSAKGVK